MPGNKPSHTPLLFTYILVIATLGQILSDLYLPSLPFIQKDLVTSANYVQLSVAIFMYGFSFAQLLYGSLSDAFGRKYTFLASLIVASSGSMIATFSQDITILLIGRLLQGIGAAGCIVTARAMIRDMYPEHLLARTISYLTITRGFMFVCIPLLGGYMQNLFGWRANFLILSIYLSIFVLIQFLFIKETNDHSHQKHINPKIILHNYYRLFTHKIFLLCCLSNLLAYGGLIAWLTAGPFLVQTVFGYSPIEFGYVCAAIGLFFAFGGVINSKIVTMENAPYIIRAGFICILLSGITLLASLWVVKKLIFMLIPIAIFFFAASIIIPNSAALCMQPFKKIAGLAVSVLGCMQVIGAAITSSIISYAPDDNQLPLALIFIAISILGLITSYYITNNSKN